MLNDPLQAALEVLALEVTPDKVAEGLRLLGPDGKVHCPLCARDSGGDEAPNLLVSSGRFTCSNPKCSATGTVVDLVVFATGLPRPDAVGLVLRIKAGQAIDLPDEPDEPTGDADFDDAECGPHDDDREILRLNAQDHPRTDWASDPPQDENIRAVIWNAQAKDAVIAPGDALGAYVHQVGMRPLLDKGEESLLGREVRSHREAYVDLMLKLDPILFQVASMLDDILQHCRSPSHVLAPSPSSNGDEPVTKRPVRPTVSAIRRYETLRQQVTSNSSRCCPKHARNATIAKLDATRKKCVTYVAAVGLRKSVLWSLYKQALGMLERECRDGGRGNTTCDDPLGLFLDEPGKDVRNATTSELLRSLRYHFSEHVRCMQELACHNLRLAIQNAIKYQWSGLPVEDLIQAANLGLLAACERFDERQGARFATYATWWIRQALLREIDNFSGLIRLPVHIRQHLRDLEEYARGEYYRTGRHPPIDELVQHTELQGDVARKVLRIGDGVVFFSELDKDEWRALRQERADTRVQSPIQDAITADLKAIIDGVVEQKLDGRSRRILESRFGLNGTTAHTLKELGVQLRVTRERVRQIQKRAMEHLRLSDLKRLVVPRPATEELEELDGTPDSQITRNGGERNTKREKK